MRILFQGDSITDADRNKADDTRLGTGYPRLVEATLGYEEPNKHEFINKGISGNRIVDLYARIKSDIINLKPDFISIYIGVNDLWHEIEHQNGVEVDRFEKIYSMLIEDTLKALPNVKIMLLEPFVLKGTATDGKMDKFAKIEEYCLAIQNLAKKYNLVSVSLQTALNNAEKVVGEGVLTFDGIHPNVSGSTIIANEWLKGFKKLL
jgi:lysophospholipase L1-like esterase